MNKMNESKKKKKKQNCVAASQLSWNNFLGEKLIINILDFRYSLRTYVSIQVIVVLSVFTKLLSFCFYAGRCHFLVSRPQYYVL